jgi:hypothetical protein
MIWTKNQFRKIQKCICLIFSLIYSFITKFKSTPNILFLDFYDIIFEYVIGIGDLRRFWRSCLGPLAYLLLNRFKLFGTPDEGYNRNASYLMKVITETRRT